MLTNCIGKKHTLIETLEFDETNEMYKITGYKQK